MPRAEIANVYEQFRTQHYVGEPLRTPVHVDAVIRALRVPPRRVTRDFWSQVSSEWLWGVSPQPFAGRHARRGNERYRKLCERKGVKP